MEWFNAWGILFIVVIMLPNILWMIKYRGKCENTWHHKIVEVLEQIGRLGCLAFMVFHIPELHGGWHLGGALALYLTVNSILLCLYCVIFAAYMHKRSMGKALTLAIIPSTVFLFSGWISGSVLLIISAGIFAPNHILITYRNAKNK